MNRSTLLFVAMAAASSGALAYEVKGISPGVDIATVDLKACRAIANADSGMPGYECDTTFANAPATMTLAVGNQQVVAVKILVRDQVMGPPRDALAEKYGAPRKDNRYIESYKWQSGANYLEIEERRVIHGYAVTAADLDLYRAFSAQQKSKAKSDL